MESEDKVVWQPTKSFFRGIVKKPFLPLKRHPELANHNDHFFDLYCGDEVYLFEETTDNKWFRGYFRWNPLPEAYISGMKAADDKFPHLRSKLVIVPRKYVEINDRSPVKEVSFLKLPNRKDFEQDVSEQCKSTCLYQSIESSKNDLNGEIRSRKPARPSFPYFRYQNTPLVKDLGPTLALLASHIYSMYAAGEFVIYKKLAKVFYELESIRMRLLFDLLTATEAVDIIRSISCLLANISKLMSSRSQADALDGSSNKVTSDPAGSEAIFGRDLTTGKLLSYDHETLSSLTYNSMLHGLHKDFPQSGAKLLQTEFCKNKIFDESHSHVLVDVFNVTSDSSIGNPKLNNVSASMYICSSTERLTEPFTVDMDSKKHSSLNSVSAALFRNICSSQLERKNIFLVVLLTEKIPITISSGNNFEAPFIPFTPGEGGSLTHIRKGIAAGAVDITRIFSKFNESNADLSVAFKFKINLYTSFSSRAPEHQNNQNNQNSIWTEGNKGWGALVDRIISDSSKGIAVNPRATSILATIKEIRANTNNSAADSTSAIKSVPTFFYDTFSEPMERIYLSLGRVAFSGNLSTNVQTLTIRLSSRNEKIRFSRTAGENLQNSWEFVSVRPGESIGGVIRVEGLEYMQDSESLQFLAYMNGILMAKSYIHIKKDGKFLSYKKYTGLQLANSMREPILVLEFASEYKGKKYNMDESLEAFLEIPKLYKSGSLKFVSTTLQVLSNLGSLTFDQQHTHFEELLETYLEIFRFFEVRDSEDFPEELQEKTFTSFVEFVDKLLIKNHRFKAAFHKYYRDALQGRMDIPDSGKIILKHMTKQFSNGYRGWDASGTRVARSSLYLLMLSVISSQRSKNDWRTSFQLFFSQVCQFLASTSNVITKDQITILQNFEHWLEIIKVYYEPESLVQFSLGLLQGCHSREKNMDIGSRKLSQVEERYSTAKLGLIRQILVNTSLCDYLFTLGTDKMMRSAFISKCIDWALLPYKSECLNISLLRMGNGILITILEKATDKKLRRNLIRLQPTLCRAFILTRKYCKENNYFKPKITFTTLFPFSLPSPVIPMDSICRAEVVVEVLLEIATIICGIAKTVENEYGKEACFKNILLECRKDIEFQTEFCSRQISNSNISTLYHTVKILARGDFFPSKKWLGVSAVYIRSSLALLSMYKKFVFEDSIPKTEGKGSISLWSMFMKGIFTIANHKVSFLIKLGIIPRKAVFRITGDLKTPAANILSESWNALACSTSDNVLSEKYGIKKMGQNQLLVLEENTSLVQEMFIFALHKHIGAQRTSCEMIWSAVVNHWRTYGTLQNFLDAAILELYNAYQSGRIYVMDYEIERLRLCILFTFHAAPEDEIYAPVVAMLEEIFGILRTISNAFKVSDDEEFDNDRTAIHVEMFGYLLDANRPELFHKMIYDLFLHFIKKRDHVQAALCLELLANTYRWNPNDMLPPIPYPPLPEQSSFERKEYLYKESAANFARGLKLEKALSIYKDLVSAYDHINYDLSGLAYVHGEISQLYTNLQTLDRLVPTYFKVSFAGFGFPKTLRNKKFIFEGLPFEHITSMHNRLLKVYHGTTIIQSQQRIDELFMKATMGRFIYVTTVEPRFEISDEYKQNGDKNNKLDNKIRMYIENRDLKTFCKSSRLPGTTTVTDLWVDEYTYQTASTFPTLMNRSEIVEVSKKKLSPIENALRSLQLKIQELNGLENMCWKVIKERLHPSEIFNELSRNLTGTIDAPVNGGMAQYRDFLKDSISSSLQKNDITMLQAAFNSLAMMVSRCLVLHREILPSESLIESHEMLVKLFEKNFAPEIQANEIKLKSLTVSSIAKTSSSQQSISMHTSRSKFQRSIHSPTTKLDRTAATSSVHSRDSTPSKSDSFVVVNPPPPGTMNRQISMNRALSVHTSNSVSSSNISSARPSKGNVVDDR